jgi:hypothetical protein
VAGSGPERPRLLMEAMACGCAVIAPRVGGTAELAALRVGEISDQPLAAGKRTAGR